MSSKQSKRKKGGVFALISALYWVAKVLTAILNAVHDTALARGLSEEEVDEKVLALGKPEGEETIKQIVSLILGQAQKVEAVVKSSLLSFVGSFTNLCSIDRFVARHFFKEDMSDTADVKIYRLGTNFRTMFLGKVEEATTEETVISYYTLLKNSKDGPIIDELGGKEKVKTTLLVLWRLLRNQRIGQSGVLLTDRWNIFYIRDNQDVLRAVNVYWDGGGWGVYAYSVELPLVWHGGSRVFSGNS